MWVASATGQSLAAIEEQRFPMSPALEVTVRSAISIATLCLLWSALLGSSAQAQTSTPTPHPTSDAQHPTPDAHAQPSGDPQLVHSPWTRFCSTDQQPRSEETCLTATEARLRGRLLLAQAYETLARDAEKFEEAEELARMPYKRVKTKPISIRYKPLPISIPDKPVRCAAASDLCAYKRIPGGRPPR
jgi:hypothetical protein